MATISDDFNRADSTDLGSSWVVNGWQIQSGNAYQSGSNEAIHNTALGSPDHSAQVTISGSGNVTRGPNARGDGTGQNLYGCYTDLSKVYLFKRVAGSFTNLGGVTPNAVSGDTLKIDVAGSTITGYRNGVQVIQRTDTSLASGSRVGMHGNPNSLLDDFTATDGVTGPTPVNVTLTLTPCATTAATPAVTVTAQRNASVNLAPAATSATVEPLTLTAQRNATLTLAPAQTTAATLAVTLGTGRSVTLTLAPFGTTVATPALGLTAQRNTRLGLTPNGTTVTTKALALTAQRHARIELARSLATLTVPALAVRLIGAVTVKHMPTAAISGGPGTAAIAGGPGVAALVGGPGKAVISDE